MTTTGKPNQQSGANMAKNITIEQAENGFIVRGPDGITVHEGNQYSEFSHVESVLKVVAEALTGHKEEDIYVNSKGERRQFKHYASSYSVAAPVVEEIPTETTTEE